MIREWHIHKCTCTCTHMYMYIRTHTTHGIEKGGGGEGERGQGGYEHTATGSTAAQMVPKRRAEEMVKLTPATESVPVSSRSALNRPYRHRPGQNTSTAATCMNNAN